MERLLTKQEIEAELERKRAGIDARIDAIKDEVQTASDDVRRTLIEKRDGRLVLGQADGIQARSVETFEREVHRLTIVVRDQQVAYFSCAIAFLRKIGECK